MIRTNIPENKDSKPCEPEADSQARSGMAKSVASVKTVKNAKSNGSTQIRYIAKQIREELTEELDIDITGVDIGSLTWMITEYDIARFDNTEYQTMRDIIPKLISNRGDTQSFSIIDIGAIIRQYRLWRRYLPNVEVFYAIKCNSDPVILRTLASLGVGFDVASMGEINMAIESEVSRDKIIYANPCKGVNHIRYARSQNVSLLTFDNENELLKIAQYHPTAKLILRILVDDITKSKMKFGCKFGCPINDVENVLNFAKFHKLNVVGVSFHVGSACLDSKSYANSIERARSVFETAKRLGYRFNILDIGGGFHGIPTNDQPYDDMSDGAENIGKEYVPSFVDIAQQIQNAVKTHFADIDDLRVIAEPGRFFATSALTLVVSITSKKSIRLDRKNTEEGDPVRADQQTSDCDRSNVDKIFHYYIDSSLYGMFNNIVFDQASVKFQLLNNYDAGGLFPTVVFGETCDSMDLIVEGVELPELTCGDYLYVENHGAYTIASSSSFNGFPIHRPFYIFTY